MSHGLSKMDSSLKFTCAWKASEDILLGSLKEVIQPQVPLRLPCYDFTPIASQTVGASFPYGLGERLRVQPTLVV